MTSSGCSLRELLKDQVLFMPQEISLKDVPGLVGTIVGVSDWITVDQPMIDAFAGATMDHQFIHTDPVRAAAETMRDNPDIDEAAAIMELGVGEALVSMLDAKGKPGITERALILPPQAQIGPISPAERSATIRGSLIAGHYEKQVDRESAHEILKARAATAAAAAETAAAEKAAAATERAGTQGAGGLLGGLLGGSGRREGVAEALAKSAARAIGNQVGRSLIRGVLGSLLGGKR
jgi:hypothetical protein